MLDYRKWIHSMASRLKYANKVIMADGTHKLRYQLFDYYTLALDLTIRKSKVWISWTDTVFARKYTEPAVQVTHFLEVIKDSPSYDIIIWTDTNKLRLFRPPTKLVYGKRRCINVHLTDLLSTRTLNRIKKSRPLHLLNLGREWKPSNRQPRRASTRVTFR
jgi:hypothetical protein